jgi:ComF family protein
MLDLVAIRECVGCGAAVDWAPLCGECGSVLRAELLPLATRHTLLARAWAVGAYTGPLGALVRRAKFSLDERAVDLLAAGLRHALLPGLGVAVDRIVPVPTTPWRLAWRGFHLPERLAEEAARATGAPVEPLLRRRWGLAQAGRSYEDRVAASTDLFEARAPARGHVLVVDDVATSGATLHGAAAELLTAGATSVSCLVLAAAGSLRRVPVGVS